MIVIQVLLITGIIAAFGWFLLNPRSQQTHAWIKIATLLFGAFAIIVVISPNTSNVIARAVGVGRGADLLLYTLTLAFVFVVINLYLKNREERERYEKLARAFALMEANLAEQRRASSKKNASDEGAQGRSATEA
ncbi:MAG TPA: DUF2304 domain-containing protein [Gaiellaceae bacterium]